MIKNKFLIVFLIFLVLVTSFSSVFASSSFVDNSGNSVSYTLPSDCGDNFLLCSWQNNEKIILYDPVNDCGYWKITKTESISGVVAYDIQLFSDDTYTTNVGYTRKTLNNSYDFSDTNEDIYYVKENYTSYTCVFSVDYGTCNVLNQDGTIFFQEPPQIVEEVGMKETLLEMGEIAKEKIIQTILIVIATAVFLVISLIGVKKSLEILVRGLKT